MKSWPKVKLSQVEVGSNMLKITRLATWSHIWPLLAPIHMTSWPKVTLGQVDVGSTIAENHSSSL